MKKFICVVLFVLMLASLGFSAFAQDWEDEWVDIDCVCRRSNTDAALLSSL